MTYRGVGFVRKTPVRGSQEPGLRVTNTHHGPSGKQRVRCRYINSKTSWKFIFSLCCYSTPREEYRGMFNPFLLSEDGEIKSFRLITLCYGHSGLFGIADSVSISYCTAITTVLDRQPEWNQINILIPPLHYTFHLDTTYRIKCMRLFSALIS